MEKCEILKFRGLTIDKNQFEDKFDVKLSDVEWNFITKNTSKKWVEDIEQVRSLATKYIRDSLTEIGYKPAIKNNQLTFFKHK